MNLVSILHVCGVSVIGSSGTDGVSKAVTVPSRGVAVRVVALIVSGDGRGAVVRTRRLGVVGGRMPVRI